MQMTREGEATTFFTQSQEELLMQGLNHEEMKHLQEQIDIETFPLLNCENLSQEINGQAYVNYNGYSIDGQEIDEKISLQPTIAMIHPPINPTPILGKEEFAGDYSFQLILNHENCGKHWVYSEKLQKVFIHMEQVLPLHFQWTPPMDGLWIRATLVYKLDQHRSQPVVRCHNHMAPDNNSNRNIDPRQVKHVIRCLHNTSNYEELPNGHMSVLIPLGTPEAGVQNVPMDFIFYCKNSCTTGMNRRPTELILTLENDQNQILGRRKLEVRVCSCPKRDKEKEENELNVSMGLGAGKKRKSAAPPEVVLPPPGKKVAGIHSDNKVYNLNLSVVGRENANAVLKSAYDIMAGAAARSGNFEQFKPYMDELSRQYHQ